MTTMQWLSLLFALGFIAVHFSAKYLKLPVSPASPWLSLCSGATVAYVFLFLLPEVNEYQEPVKKAAEQIGFTFFNEYTLLLALAGFFLYYALDTLTKTKDENKAPAFHVFVLHVSSFFFYNIVIGYLIIRQDFETPWQMALYFFALSAHFIRSDHSLKSLHQKDYDKYGRWFLVGAIFTGWLTGFVFHVPEAAAGIAVSLMSGAIILNAFKDELHEGNVKMFASGVLIIALLHGLVY